MIKIGDFNTLQILRKTSNGMYLDDGDQGILLPTRFVPEGVNVGDSINVFIYHDKQNLLIATTQIPKAKIGDIVLLKCVDSTPQGAYLDNGLMKDLFVPLKNQVSKMIAGHDYLVMIYLDNLSQRLVATEHLDPFLSNELLSVQINEEVDLLVYRKTKLGYQMIINHKHQGILHQNEVFRDLHIGDRFKGFIKNILPGNKIDVVAGKKGFDKASEEGDKILKLLQAHDGYLPYHDKTEPETIYKVFGMSKKTFKMALGGLYKSQKIKLEKDGIRVV